MRGSKKQYRVSTVKEAKAIALSYLKNVEVDKVTKFGLPEVDDRFDIWRVLILSIDNTKVGEVVIDAITTFIDEEKTAQCQTSVDKYL